MAGVSYAEAGIFDLNVPIPSLPSHNPLSFVYRAVLSSWSRAAPVLRAFSTCSLELLTVEYASLSRVAVSEDVYVCVCYSLIKQIYMASDRILQCKELARKQMDAL